MMDKYNSDPDVKQPKCYIAVLRFLEIYPQITFSKFTPPATKTNEFMEKNFPT